MVVFWRGRLNVWGPEVLRPGRFDCGRRLLHMETRQHKLAFIFGDHGLMGWHCETCGWSSVALNDLGEILEAAALRKFSGHTCPPVPDGQLGAAARRPPQKERAIKQMTGRRRRLILTKIEYGAPIAAHCSVCQRQFEAGLGENESLSTAHSKLAAMSDDHSCTDAQAPLLRVSDIA